MHSEFELRFGGQFSIHKKKTSGYITFMSLKYLKAALIKPKSDCELESDAAVAVVMGEYFSEIE